jgi:hypothetical protein
MDLGERVVWFSVCSVHILVLVLVLVWALLVLVITCQQPVSVSGACRFSLDGSP